MLCFLPLVPPPGPPRRPRRPPPPFGSKAAGLTLGAIVALALLTPFGWVHPQPVYAMRVGAPGGLGPRPEDRALVAQLARPAVAARPVFFARAGRYDAVPPGLHVDPASGALVGVPTLAGTYTLALGVSDGGAGAVTGSTFRVKVLPAP